MGCLSCEAVQASRNSHLALAREYAPDEGNKFFCSEHVATVFAAEGGTRQRCAWMFASRGGNFHLRWSATPVRNSSTREAEVA
jgi:hypothetical protein